MLRGEAKAEQVYLILRDRILTGAVALGAKLATENELAQVHGVSRVTTSHALVELARERLIDQRRGASRRVGSAPMGADVSGRRANLADIGRRTTVTLASFAQWQP